MPQETVGKEALTVITAITAEERTLIIELPNKNTGIFLVNSLFSHKLSFFSVSAVSAVRGLLKSNYARMIFLQTPEVTEKKREKD